MRARWILIPFIMIAAGCATTAGQSLSRQSDKPIDTAKVNPLERAHYSVTMFGAGGQAKEVTRQFAFPYNRVWTATVETLQEIGHPVTVQNEKTGTISTDYLPREGGPWFLGTPADHFRDRFMVRVTKSRGVVVGIRRVVERQDKRGQYVPKTSDGVVEQWLLEKIGDRLKSQAPKR